MSNVKRSINTDRVIDIANAILDNFDNIFEHDLFPEKFSHAELAIASIVACREIEKESNPLSLPSEIYLDEFVKSYMEFVNKVKEEV